MQPQDGGVERDVCDKLLMLCDMFGVTLDDLVMGDVCASAGRGGAGNPWTALFTFCNMLITFAVLKKFLFKPVKQMIDDRQQEIDTMYADADAAKQKAADLEKEYADHLQSIKDERDTMLREATARAQKREEEIVNEAKAEAASIRAAAEADIAQERKKAVNDLKNEIGGMAVEIAGKVVEREIRESDHQALIDEFIRNVGDAS